MKLPKHPTRGKALDIAHRILETRDRKIREAEQRYIDLANDQLMELYEVIPEDWKRTIERELEERERPVETAAAIELEDGDG